MVTDDFANQFRKFVSALCRLSPQRRVKDGWQSDEDCERWWKKEDLEKIYTLDEAIRAYEDWLYVED